MSDFSEHPDYDNLPDVIKQYYTPKEYSWLGDEDRARLFETECNPEPEEP
jgi:hypothetical protein